jgi:multiple sugar transport system substrate-binding protein
MKRNHNWLKLWTLSLVAGLVMSACAPQTVTVEVTRAVEVRVTQEVTKEVQVEVTRAVGAPTISFWSTETQPNRAAATQAIIDRFTAATGIGVKLVLTDEDSLPNLMTAAVAAKTLPDVVFHPLDFTLGWSKQGILDAAAATAVINELGAETFATGPLDLVKVGNEYAAVPSDGWGQIIIYRADLFKAAGLQPPTTYETILAAAEKLNDPGNNFYGITMANDAGAVFTQQTFEHIALANNCQLVDANGNVTLNSPACVEAVNFYNELMTRYSPQGKQDVAGTRATYFAGQAAMIIWSPFILDEMAGLRDNAFPACPECKADPAYLAKNSGIIPAFAGPSGSPAQYGQISNMGITTNANTEAAQQFLKFWFNEGYLDWLAVAAEGKFPMRRGTADEPTKFVEGWKQLQTGVDRKAALSEFYSDETINTLIEGAGSFNRWGFPQAQGPLVSAVYEALIVPRLLNDVIGGNLTPEEAAADMQTQVEELKANLK